MSLKLQPNVGLQTVLKEGTKHLQGLDEAVYRNIAAVLEMSSITRTSFGPNGLNKLLVNNLDKVFLTSDTGTILKEIDVQHPAARLVLMASQQQDAEVGDGTNLVVILTAALLERARDLLKMGLKPSVVAEGFTVGYEKARDLLNQMGQLKEGDLEAIVKTVLMAKQCGVHDKLAELVMEACNVTGECVEAVTFAERNQLVNPDNIRCVKILGGSLHDAYVVPGVVLNRSPESVCQSLAGGVKVAVYACPIDIAQTETKGTVLFNNAAEMKAFSKDEESFIEARIKAVADTGAKLMVTNEKVGDVALHFANQMGLMIIRVTSKFDLRRICLAVGAPAMVKFAAPTANQIGFCESIESIEIGSDRCTVIRCAAGKSSKIASIVMRGSTMNVMDDYERAIEDAVNVVRVLSKQDKRVVPGAGATEAELSRQLHDFAACTPGVMQYALRAYAEALECIPGQLAYNSGYDRTDAIAKLMAVHVQGRSTWGISIDGSKREPLCDAEQSNIWDSFAVKQKALYLAWEAANTVLLVDQIIMSKPAGGPKPRAPGGQDQDD